MMMAMEIHSTMPLMLIVIVLERQHLILTMMESLILEIIALLRLILIRPTQMETD